MQQEGYYVGLDVHKQSVSFCVKRADGSIVSEGRVRARRALLCAWALALPGPWEGAMEATLFSGWIYDVLQPYASKLEMAHPPLLKAIVAGKKKSDRLDARTIADLVRCHLVPACYVAPAEMRERRRLLRYRRMVVRQAVRMKNKIAGLLMECGVEYCGTRLHGKKYFQELVEGLSEVPSSVKELLAESRGTMEMFEATQKKLERHLEQDALVKERVERLQTIPGVGLITALTWVLEVGEGKRFSSVKDAVSYCGLTARLDSSADKVKRGPLSKQRNSHLQSVLIEAAHVAPRWHATLAAVAERERARGHRNRATLAVARKLVAYLLAVDRSGQPFHMRTQETPWAPAPVEPMTVVTSVSRG